ncbi:MAG: mechanosensitive ion channel family protein [Pseudolabrys sp.]
MIMMSSLLNKELHLLLDGLTAWAALELPRILGAVLLLMAGWWFSSRAQRATAALLTRQTRIDPTLRGLLSSLVHYGILILVIVAALGEIGVETTSILAALGAAGLAIGLALQGTLSNIAAGLMLIWLRPFRVGDYVETASFAGTVHEVGLFATELHSTEGVFQFVPNSELWNKRIVNYTRLRTRMVDLKFGISYADDTEAARQALLAAVASDARIETDPAPFVFVDELADSAVVMRLRCWTPTPDYWSVRRAMMENGKIAIERAGLTIPYPQRDVHVRGEALMKKAAA